MVTSKDRTQIYWGPPEVRCTNAHHSRGRWPDCADRCRGSAHSKAGKENGFEIYLELHMVPRRPTKTNSTPTCWNFLRL